MSTPEPTDDELRELKRARRREVADVVKYLKSDLYKRDRDYSNANLERPVGPVDFDEHAEALWGSPFGWRVIVSVAADESLTLRIHSPDGRLYLSSPSFYAHGHGDAVGWLENALP